jgi:hypothetical protein
LTNSAQGVDARQGRCVKSRWSREMRADCLRSHSEVDAALSSVETGKLFTRERIWQVLAVVEARQRRWFEILGRKMSKRLGAVEKRESRSHHQLKGWRGVSCGGKQVYSGSVRYGNRWESLPRYGMWLQSPRWLIPKVAQPQVPLSKKSETDEVRFCVCPHTTRLEIKRPRRRVVVVTVTERGWWL